MSLLNTFKCKMCGGDIQVSEGAAFGTCDSCGITSTLPKASDEKLVNLFNRANHFRRLNEFDKALTAYENILNEDQTNAEAHWCVVLCRYGIEYVEDPRTHERIPTCHRTQRTPILKDADCLAALEYAGDIYTRGLYEAEAKKINEIQKDILAVSGREEPFDVFICYKETTDGGSRTKDSVLAQDIYHQLKDDYQVFFSKITLEDKLGQAYEPYIFSALNSAQVMLVIGTKAEHFNAVWVKNEWSRFLAFTKEDRSKLLIPCYQDMDAYDLPEELSMLQSQDMSKIGFMQDVIRGVKKVMSEHTTSNASSIAQATDNANSAIIDSYMKRGTIFLEDEEWAQADEYFDKVLDINPEYALAYIGKLCAELKLCTEEDLKASEKLLSTCSGFQKAVRFADLQYCEILNQYDEISRDRLARRSEKRAFIMKTKNKLAAGEKYSIGVNTNGKVVIVGQQDYNQNTLLSWHNIKSVAAASHIVGLKHDGSVVATGAYWSGQCDVEKWRGMIAIAAGYCFTIGLRANGTVIAAGDKKEPQCNVLEWKNITAIAAGHKHTVGLKNDGTVIAVGDNQFHQCDTANWKNMIAIAAGDYHTVGLKSDGTVIFCGGHMQKIELKGASESRIMLSESQCGQFTFKNWNHVVAIAAGPCHTVALKEDGTVLSYGTNHYNECNVSRWQDIIAVAAGDFHTIGLKSDGTVVATGDNVADQCNVSSWQSIGLSPEELLTPEEIAERKRKEQEKAAQQTQELMNDKSLDAYRSCIAVGYNHAVGLCKDGTIVVAGENAEGQILKKDLEKWHVIVAVSAGEDFTVGLRQDGTVTAIGRNKEGACNTQNWGGIVAISAGRYHTVGLRQNGTVIAVGDNENGQCKTQLFFGIIAVSAGGSHTVGLRQDGSVIAVGRNNDGQCNTQDWGDIVAVSAGSNFTAGLKSDGTLVTAGNNNCGQRNTQGWGDIVAISAGCSHLVGVKSDGTVIATGKDNFHQCNVKNWKNIVAVFAGNEHTIGFMSTGEAIAAGKDSMLVPTVFAVNTHWKNIGSATPGLPLKIETDPIKIKADLAAASAVHAKEQEKQAQSERWKEEGRCAHCGGILSGLFVKKCKSCGKTNDGGLLGKATDFINDL